MDGYSSYNNLLIDLSNDEYFKYANNLAINYIRAMQAPKVEPKQEFEKTQDYEERIKQAQQNGKNNVIDYDVEVLERALNSIVPDITADDSDNTYQYDADQELMTIHFKQKSRYSSAETLPRCILQLTLCVGVATCLFRLLKRKYISRRK